MDLLPAKAELISDGSSASEVMYLRMGRRNGCATSIMRQDWEYVRETALQADSFEAGSATHGEEVVPLQPMEVHREERSTWRTVVHVKDSGEVCGGLSPVGRSVCWIRGREWGEKSSRDNLWLTIPPFPFLLCCCRDHVKKSWLKLSSGKLIQLIYLSWVCFDPWQYFVTDFSLFLSQCTSLWLYFLSSVQQKRGVMNQLWWAPGVQPESTYPNNIIQEQTEKC